nr:SLC13 family permease [Streptomyces sp. MK37H]
MALAVGALGFDLEIGFLALAAGALLALVDMERQVKAVDGVSWSTLLLVAGMMTYIAMLEKAGIIEEISEHAAGLGAPVVVALLLCFTVAIPSAFASSTAILAAIIPIAVPLLLSEEQVRAVVQALVDHHPMLRLSLTATGPIWSLEVLPTVPVELNRPGPPTDPERGRMVHARWSDPGSGTAGALTLTVHHLAVDGVSWRTLRDDLDTAWRPRPTRRDRGTPQTSCASTGTPPTTRNSPAPRRGGARSCSPRGRSRCTENWPRSWPPGTASRRGRCRGASRPASTVAHWSSSRTGPRRAAPPGRWARCCPSSTSPAAGERTAGSGCPGSGTAEHPWPAARCSAPGDTTRAACSGRVPPVPDRTSTWEVQGAVDLAGEGEGLLVGGQCGHRPDSGSLRVAGGGKGLRLPFTVAELVEADAGALEKIGSR